MKNILFIIFTMICSYSNGQYFTGEINYKTTLKNRKTNEIIGTEYLTYVISEKNYRVAFYQHDKLRLAYTYNHVDKKIYDENAQKQYITFRSSTDFNREFQRPNYYPDSIKYVLGEKCYMLKQEANGYVYRTYYSLTDNINFENFKEHNVGNWYKRQQIVNGAIPLRIESVSDKYLSITEAITLDRRIIEDNEFNLPQKEIYASSEILDQSVKIRPFTEEQINCFKEKIKPFKNKKYMCRVSMIVKKDGSITNLNALNKDPDGFHETVIDIVKNCNFEFSTGQFNGQDVDCEIIIPITIN